MDVRKMRQPPYVEPLIEVMCLGSTINPDTGCWEWQGPFTRDGYGRFSHQFSDGEWFNTTLHRFIFQAVFFIPCTGTVIRHYECANRACWNPDHLRVGSRRDNNRDTARDGHLTEWQRKNFWGG